MAHRLGLGELLGGEHALQLGAGTLEESVRGLAPLVGWKIAERFPVGAKAREDRTEETDLLVGELEAVLHHREASLDALFAAGGLRGGSRLGGRGGASAGLVGVGGARAEKSHGGGQWKGSKETSHRETSGFLAGEGAGPP